MIRFYDEDTFGWCAAVGNLHSEYSLLEESDSVLVPWDESSTKLGEKDLVYIKTLIKCGSPYSKLMELLNVVVDIDASLYWWQEFNAYKVGTVLDGYSIMNKVTVKKFGVGDFSCEDLIGSSAMTDLEQHIRWSPVQVLATVIDCLNAYRDLYLQTNDKKYWRQIIQLLPQSYNHRATVRLSYAELRSIYSSIKHLELDEWRTFEKWVQSLLYSELITA